MDGSPAPDTTHLPDRIGAGERRAEAELYRRFERRVTVLAARRGVPDRRIEDVVQETMMGVVQALREGRLENDSRLAAFVYGTARNVISNWRRRRSLTAWPQAVEDTDLYAAGGPDPLRAVLDGERRSRVAGCLERLRDEDRELLRLAYFEGLAPREIAERLGEESSVIRQRKWRALKRFEAIWRESEPR